MDFCTTLEGFYDNRNQAVSNPIKYSHCQIRWERIGENELTSRQWYHYEGEDKPYRYRWHRVIPFGDITIVENWSPDWEEHNACCDMIFSWKGYYSGKVATDECFVNGGNVKSVVEFDGKYYRSKDQGWKDGVVVWGDDIVYEFDKL